jgi:hypothetical protein
VTTPEEILAVADAVRVARLAMDGAAAAIERHRATGKLLSDAWEAARATYEAADRAAWEAFCQLRPASGEDPRTPMERHSR